MQLVTVSDSKAASEQDCARALEHGDILFFPVTPFELPEADQQFLRSLSGASGPDEKLGAAHHKNVAYKPALDKVSGHGSADAGRLRDIFHRYSESVVGFVGALLPRYRAKWKLDYASFRSEEEEGRDLPWNKRNDLLHVDSFPSRPTNGDLILRVFTNINPSKTRVWLTGDPFETLAKQYAVDAGLDRIASSARSAFAPLKRALVKTAGPLLRVPDRSPYDRFMLGFHDYLKHNAEYQKSSTKYRFEFPPGSTWMVFTDIVPHAVLSGQYALEQTFIIARSSLSCKACAPANILEHLSHCRLTYS
jgi:hypothetical protein